MKKIVFLILTVIVLVSCSKNNKNYSKNIVNGVEIITNKNRPSDPNFKIELKKKYVLKADTAIRQLFWHTYEDGKMYVTDNKLSRMNIFDDKGKLINSFGRKGNGPGEFDGDVMRFSILGDTIFFPQGKKSLLIKYSKNGKFLGTKTYEDRKELPMKLSQFGNKYLSDLKYARYIDHEWKNGGKEYMSVVFYDKNKNATSEKICSRVRELSKNISQIPNDYLLWANTKKFLYTVPSMAEYEVNVYDQKGELVRKIKKNFIKEPLPEKEQEVYKNLSKRVGYKYDLVKTPIWRIRVDYKERLWIMKPVYSDADSIEYDLFDKDGIFINTLKFSGNGHIYLEDNILTIGNNFETLEVYEIVN